MPAATLKQGIGKRLRAVTLHHRQKWREWVHALAEGKSEPSAADVCETAAHLKIDDPAERLEADAQTIREVRAAERTIAICEAGRAELVRQFGGDVENIRAAIATAKAEVARLEEVLDRATWPSEWSFRAEADRLRRDNPDLFTEEPSR